MSCLKNSKTSNIVEELQVDVTGTATDRHRRGASMPSGYGSASTAKASGREVYRCRHAALGRLLLRPTETFAGDPDHCRMIDDFPDDPPVANASDTGSSDARGAHGDRSSRGA